MYQQVVDHVQVDVGLRGLFDKVPSGYIEDALYDLVAGVLMQP